jgi:hypothetical protein
LATLKAQLQASLEIAYFAGKLLGLSTPLRILPTLARRKSVIVERQSGEVGKPPYCGTAIAAKNMLNKV